MKLEINVGTIKANYTLCLTDAPCAYDGFGTLLVVDYEQRVTVGDATHPWPRPARGPARLVAIRDEHFDYQTGRYGSGLHCVWDGDDVLVGALHLTARDIDEILFLRLFKAA